MGKDTRSTLRNAVRLVLERAERDPEGPLPYEALPEVRSVFRDRRELLLALQWTWSQALWTHIETRAGVRTVDLAAAAWAECTARHPVLRRLLDRYADELGPSPGRVAA